jgi:hypothetical protein
VDRRRPEAQVMDVPVVLPKKSLDIWSIEKVLEKSCSYQIRAETKK